MGSLLAMLLSPEHHFPVQELGIGIGSVCVGAGGLIAAVGAFRMGDKPHAGTTTVMQTSQSTTEVKPPTISRNTPE